MSTQYCKQSDIIEAIRNPSPDNQDTVATPKWIVEAFMTGELTQDETTGVVFIRDADMQVGVDEWIVFLGDGKFTAMSHEEFTETYVPIAANLHRI